MENNNEPQYYQQPEPTWNNDAPASNAGDGNATASLVTGILGVICCGPCAVAAIILSITAKNKGTSKSGLATAGLVLGIIGCILWVVGIIYQAINPIDYSQFFG